MNINLRKAHALQQSINEEINAVSPLATTVSIGRFQDKDVVYSEAVLKFNDNYSRVIELTGALYDIRKLTAKATQVSGISDNLADIASLDAVIRVIRPLSQVIDFAPSEGELAKIHLDLQEEKSGEGYRTRREAVSVGMVGKNAVDQYKKVITEFRKQKQEISDKILELNVSTNIELAESTVSVLKKYGII